MVYFKSNYVEFKFVFLTLFYYRKTCTNRFAISEILGSTHLKVRKWQCSLSNPATSSKFLFRVMMLGRQPRVES